MEIELEGVRSGMNCSFYCQYSVLGIVSFEPSVGDGVRQPWRRTVDRRVEEMSCGRMSQLDHHDLRRYTPGASCACSSLISDDVSSILTAIAIVEKERTGDRLSEQCHRSLAELNPAATVYCRLLTFACRTCNFHLRDKKKRSRSDVSRYCPHGHPRPKRKQASELELLENPSITQPYWGRAALELGGCASGVVSEFLQRDL
jgi:hypothetical protein